MVTPDEALALLAEVIRTDSVNPPGNEQRVAEVLEPWLAARGVEVEVRPLEAGRANLVARVRGGGRQPALVFCGHMDTVPLGSLPWSHAPFGAEIEAGEMYGRGTADMKSGLVAAVVALARQQARATPLPGDVVLLATAGEELGSVGAATLLEQGAFAGAGAVVIGEPTGMDVGVAHKGALWLRAIFAGRPAHGSMPHLGSNAIQHAARFLRALESFDLGAPAHALLGPATISANQIQAGTANNVVPDRCEVTLDIRTVPGVSHPAAIAALEALVKASVPEALAAGSGLEVILDRAAVDTDPNSAIVRAAVRAGEAVTGAAPPVRGMTYFTDGSLIGPATGLPMVILGPGEAGQAHQTDEHVSVGRFLACVGVYERLAGEYLGAPDARRASAGQA
jgi:succinyl-diaminopimelate desuccinylase